MTARVRECKLLLVAVGCGIVLLGGLAVADGRPVPAVDPSELRPGGDATSLSRTFDRNAFSQTSGNLNFEQQLTFKLGNAIFRKLWVSAPASTKSSDGLGPLYNARSCQRCHLKDGRGHPPEKNWPNDDAVSMIMRLSVPPVTDPDRDALASGRVNSLSSPRYGGQLQDFSVQGHDAEGRFSIRYSEQSVVLGDGTIVKLRAPTYRLQDLNYGPPETGLMMSPRVAPQMIGLGLLEAVDDVEIRTHVDPDDRDGDGISGRLNMVWSTEKNVLTIGRFGWKAGVPTLRQQAADAFSGDIGISSSLIPQGYGDCTAAQPVCRNAPHGGSVAKPEINDTLLDLVTFYTRNLAVPSRRRVGDPEVERGRAVFHETGCAACHRPRLETGKNANDPNLRGQTIWPYTDLLLHDMGAGLADGRPEGRANGQEWRTPPLWGIGLTKAVSGHTYFLHDGRARNVLEAVLWHGGEAQASRDGFAALGQADRNALIAFVNSL